MKDEKKLEISLAIRDACKGLTSQDEVGMFTDRVQPVLEKYRLRLKGAAKVSMTVDNRSATVVRIAYTKGMMDLKTEILFK